MKKNNIRINYILFIICFYALIFQNLIQNYFSFFSYFDEILALISIPVFIIKLLKNRYKNNSIKINSFFLLLSLIAIFFVGIAGTIINNYQSLVSALYDAILFFKFFLVMLLSRFLWDNSFIQNNSYKIKKHLKFITTLLLLLTISNYIFSIWPNVEYRFGIMTNQLFYSHPTYLAAVCIFIISLWYIIEKKVLTISIIIMFIILISTLRFKAIGALAAIIMLSIIIDKTNKKMSFSKIGIIAIITAIFAYNQIINTFINNDLTARSQLLIKSLEIMKDYFPIGTGFGTYGSYISSINYSEVYYKYELNTVYGLEPSNPVFICDSFWPMVFGQFGFIGALLYLYILYLVYKKIQHSFSIENKYFYIAKYCCFSYLLISSIAETAFVNPLAIPLAIIIGIDLSQGNNQEKVK